MWDPPIDYSIILAGTRQKSGKDLSIKIQSREPG